MADVGALRQLIFELTSVERFVVRAPLEVAFELLPNEVVFWELFHGRALDRGQTRERRAFESWRLLERNKAQDEAIISVKWDHETNEIHVTRGILCRTWEAHDAQGMIESREVIKRVRELVGTIANVQDRGIHDLRAELSLLLQDAVVGGSRLPLTSWESPLPEFLTGHFFYSAPLDESVSSSLAHRANAMHRELESHLRCGALPGDPRLLQNYIGKNGGSGLLKQFSRLLNDTSLSPVTGWLDNLLRTVATLEEGGHVSACQTVDFLTGQLRLLFRHLNAFDLVQFHHRGANYPDAIWLEKLLRASLQRAVDHPELFLTKTEDAAHEDLLKQRRRFGLLAGWLLFERYRGVKVPDEPTSPGENRRVFQFLGCMPVPEEQILDPVRRRRRLFDDDWRTSFDVSTILRACCLDLTTGERVRELGRAIFLDRPFAFFKKPGEPDRSPLLSYLAESRRVARQWLDLLGRTYEDAAKAVEKASGVLDSLPVRGVEQAVNTSGERLGIACLEDARLVADDFRFLTLTHTSAELLTRVIDFRPLVEQTGVELKPGRFLLMRTEFDPRNMTLYDADFQVRAELEWDPRQGMIQHCGLEAPASGLTVKFGRTTSGEELDLSQRTIRLPARVAEPR